MIIANQNIKGDATLKAAELKESADFQRARLTELYSKLQDTDHNLKKIETEISKINRQLTELNEKKDLSTSEVVVAIDVKEATMANFRLSYLVRQSAWYPTYDIRVQDISQPLALQVKANIKQQSGEDWKEVKLFLSTGNPDENSTKPVLSPWYLRYYYPEASSQIRIRGASAIASSFDGSNRITGVVRNQRGEPVEVVVTGLGISRGSENFYESSPAIRKKKEENNVTTSTSYQPTTTIFEIESPYSVPDDGKLYTVDINSYELTALYEYYAAPKLDPSAYLTAKVIDWQELNLLPGDANLFFEGTFLGSSFLDVYNAGDTLNLSLGKDKGVVVKRTMLKDYSSKKFLGSNKTDSRQYEISIRNNKSQPVKVIVEDQFPVSTNKDIEVDKLSYDNAKLDEDTRKITWSVAIETKKENKLQFGYVVKYPRDK
ncbi:hypothetical protein OSTOST_13926, partial [Ostertagia ostertagi]